MDEHQKRFVKILDQLSYSRSSISVLNDWAEMSAISLHNSVLLPNSPEWKPREDRYLQIVKHYKREEVELLCEMFACVVMSLETNHDALGELYMTDEVAGRSKWDSDVCFTPWELAFMTAKMTLTGFTLPKRGWFRIAEPACGTGCMVIAAAAVLREDYKLNPQRVMHATLVDIRLNLVHMAYLQLSLLHIPAVVIHGDTLRAQEWTRWRTPAHVLGFWERKCPVEFTGIPLPVMDKPQLELFKETTDDSDRPRETHTGRNGRTSQASNRNPAARPAVPNAKRIADHRTKRRTRGKLVQH